jgi:hypothetical protein
MKSVLNSINKILKINKDSGLNKFVEKVKEYNTKDPIDAYCYGYDSDKDR